MTTCHCISCQSKPAPGRTPDPKYQAAYESWCADMGYEPLPIPCDVGKAMAAAAVQNCGHCPVHKLFDLPYPVGEIRPAVELAIHALNRYQGNKARTMAEGA